MSKKPSRRKRFEVEWTRPAFDDLADILRHVSFDSPSRARRLVSRLRLRAASLGRFPLRGRCVPEFEIFGVSTFRELVYPPYRLVFRIVDQRVLVLAVLDGRRDLDEILMRRLIMGWPTPIG